MRTVSLSSCLIAACGPSVVDSPGVGSGTAGTTDVGAESSSVTSGGSAGTISSTTLGGTEVGSTGSAGGSSGEPGPQPTIIAEIEGAQFTYPGHVAYDGGAVYVTSLLGAGLDGLAWRVDWDGGVTELSAPYRAGRPFAVDDRLSWAGPLPRGTDPQLLTLAEDDTSPVGVTLGARPAGVSIDGEVVGVALVDAGLELWEVAFGSTDPELAFAGELPDDVRGLSFARTPEALYVGTIGPDGGQLHRFVPPSPNATATQPLPDHPGKLIVDTPGVVVATTDEVVVFDVELRALVDTWPRSGLGGAEAVAIDGDDVIYASRDGAPTDRILRGTVGAGQSEVLLEEPAETHVVDIAIAAGQMVWVRKDQGSSRFEVVALALAP